jgi:signal transduction histidine kinase
VLFQIAAIFGVTTHASVFFPPAGLSVAALLLLGPRFMPLVTLASLMAGLPYWLPERPVGWIASALVNGVGYGLGVGWYRRRMALAADPSLLFVVGWFLVVASLTVIANAAVLGAVFHMAGTASLGEALHHASLIWVGDLIGVVTITPLVLVLSAVWAPDAVHRQLPWMRLFPMPGLRRCLPQIALSLLALTAVYAAPHLFETDARFWHLLFIPAIWIALTAGLPSALVATSTINLGNVAVASIFGPSIALPELQSLMLAISAVTLILGAMASDRTHAIHRLEAVVTERTQALSSTNQSLTVANRALSAQSDRLRHSLAELHAAHTRLQETQRQLVEAEKLAALGQMVAGFAHELNSPLGAALTAASHLSDETQDLRSAAVRGDLRRATFDRVTTTAIEAAGLVLANLRRAVDLVHSFKMVAADQTSDERRRFQLDECLDDVIRSLSPLWQTAGHACTVHCGRGIEMDSYPGALAQIVTNLVTNALTHGFVPGLSGQITITVSPWPGETASDHDTADMIEISVTDDGCGIAATHLPRLFDPFFTTRRAHGCTGLGLHIVHNLVVQRLGGTITVTSTVDAGTRFVLRLPRVSPDRPAITDQG